VSHGGTAGPREIIRGIKIHNSKSKIASTKAKRSPQGASNHAKILAGEDLGELIQMFRTEGKTLQKMTLALRIRKEGEKFQRTFIAKEMVNLDSTYLEKMKTRKRLFFLVERK
jgi:hypothetical protein